VENCRRLYVNLGKGWRIEDEPMQGRWHGTYSGTNTGQIVVEIDDRGCEAGNSSKSVYEHNAYSWSSWTVLGWLIGTTVVAISILFYRLGALPIVVWDEARLANNALEMARTGLSLITTYDGIPDHLNTKPPLLIWLMSISIRALGPNEWAVRLPSVSAALATVAIVFAFCNFRLKRPFVGFSAVLVLFLGSGYIQPHAARSGDYDATLALWTTGYLLAGYMYLHGPPSKRRLWLLLCTAGIVLAFLTKTVQGLIFLPALLIYAVSQGRIVEILRSPATYVNGATALLLCAGYYFVREQMDPGYFAASMANDWLGRYLAATDSNIGGRLFYVRFFPLLFTSVLFVGFQFWCGRGERRQISVFLGLVLLFYLLIISLSATKLSWYAVPLLPLSAMIVAVGLDEALVWMATRGHWFRMTINGVLVPLCVLAGLGVIAENIHLLTLTEAFFINRQPYLSSVFLRGPVVQSRSPKKFVVIQQSYDSGWYYVAPTLFYVNALRAAGHSIEVQPPSAIIPAGFDTVVMCGAVRNAVTVEVVLQPVIIDGECGIYRVAPSELPAK
jgi:4-amino-4-deoxy-L-arabinose transferase-like glycosyltransferase